MPGVLTKTTDDKINHHTRHRKSPDLVNLLKTDFRRKLNLNHATYLRHAHT